MSYDVYWVKNRAEKIADFEHPTQSDMRSIIILLPPLTEQKRISVKVKYLFRLLDSIACNL